MKTCKILAADDNPLNLKLIIRLLKSLGHTGIAVNDGQKVLKCLESMQFDVILLDVTMPVMDGLEAMAEIRKLEARGRPRTPIILVTGHNLPGDREQYLAKGADGYLSKPIDTLDLEREISRVTRTN